MYIYSVLPKPTERYIFLNMPAKGGIDVKPIAICLLIPCLLEVAHAFIATIRPWWLSIGNTSWNNALDMQESNQTKKFSRNV